MNGRIGAWRTLGPRLLFPLHPSYDTHRQFDYGVCVQHFGEHVSDDRRKRGRKEGRRRIIGNRDTQQREGTFRACALPCEGKCPYLSWLVAAQNGSLEVFILAYYYSRINIFRP